MTTVTERRTIRAINEDNSKSSISEAINGGGGKAKQGDVPKPGVTSGEVDDNSTDQAKDQDSINANDLTNSPKDAANETDYESISNRSAEVPNASELSLALKLGNMSLINNSLKPNSAVRQLFPDPRFISPPPAPAKVITMSNPDDNYQDANNPDAIKQSIATSEAAAGSRLFDSGSSAECGASAIKKSIERNSLRRSLVGKFDASSKRKNLRNKDLTLEERIRQLTCVDDDDDDRDSSIAESITMNDVSVDSTDFPVRTSPPGEERPKTTNTRPPATALCNNSVSVSTSPQMPAHHHHHHPSAYRKLTDLFGQKKLADGTMTNDLGGISKASLAKAAGLKTLESRKQFLASLAPLSCVGSLDSHDDYYQLSSKIMPGDNRDYMSDSSYSLEDIEAALKAEDLTNHKNVVMCPPDVTKGTPIGGMSIDANELPDELLAFVEQDKTRTERIKKRYDVVEDRHDSSSMNGSIVESNGKIVNCGMEDDDDDETNDYGFNRRPSVRGIKSQSESSEDDLLEQIRSRISANALAVSRSANFQVQWPYYEKGSVILEKKVSHEDDETLRYSAIAKENGGVGGGGDNTIKRINTMQKQIDDIYQTITAETAVNVQDNMEQHGSTCISGSLPRPVMRMPVGDGL